MASEDYWKERLEVIDSHLLTLYFSLTNFRFELLYYGTREIGVSKTGAKDLKPWTDENVAIFGEKSFKRKSLRVAFDEALTD